MMTSMGVRRLLLLVLVPKAMTGAFSLQPGVSHKRCRIRPIHRMVSSSTSSPSSSSSSPSASSTSPPRRFYILRHGETDANASGIIQGSADISRLTAKGKEQAATIGSAALCPIATNGEVCSRIAAVYVSPLSRARDTLTILRQTAPKDMLPSEDIVMESLREIDFYAWEGRCKKELQRQYPEEFAAWRAGDPDGLVVDGRYPLWETWDRAAMVWEEIRSAVEEQNKEHNNHDADTATLLVCHGTLGQALLGTAFGLDATIFRKNSFPNCGMAEILWHADDDLASSWRWHYPEPTEHGCMETWCSPN
jgi:broad specificity phosphatase PhoE